MTQAVLGRAIDISPRMISFYESGNHFPKDEEALKRMVKSVGETYRAEMKLEWIPIVPPAINHPDMAALGAEAAKKVLGDEALYHYDKTNGGEDTAYFIEKAPGALAFLGVGCEECGRDLASAQL